MQRSICSAVVISALTAPAVPADAQTCTPQWAPTPGFGVFDDGVYTMTEYDDGGGLDLYVGGLFHSAAGVPMEGIARWDAAGAKWSDVGGGVSGGNADVIGLTVYDGSLIAIGQFDTAGEVFAAGIAAWNGASWSPLGAGLAGGALDGCVTTYGGDLIAGGWFTHAGGIPASRIARWDGATWHPLGAGVSSFIVAFVLGMTEYDGDLIVVGVFTNAGPHLVDSIARWDGTDWHAMDGLVSGLLTNSTVVGNDLYTVGAIQSAGGVATGGIARWDGAAWHPVGGGIIGNPFDVRGFGGRLFVGGGTGLMAGATPINGLGVWDGSTWSAMGAGVTGDWVDALHVSTAGDLIVGGTFTEAGGKATMHMARIECLTQCYPDCNEDSALTIADFGCFQSKFVASDPWADCNADTALTIADFACFQSEFVAGCP